jgi:hypothetical protein
MGKAIAITRLDLTAAKAGDPVITGHSNKTTADVYWMPRFRGA